MRSDCHRIAFKLKPISVMMRVDYENKCGVPKMGWHQILTCAHLTYKDTEFVSSFFLRNLKYFKSMSFGRATTY